MTDAHAAGDDESRPAAADLSRSHVDPRRWGGTRRWMGENTVPPSVGIVYNLPMRARQRKRVALAPPGTLVGRSSGILPIVANDEIVTRSVTVMTAVRVSGATIIAHRVAWEDEHLGTAVDCVLVAIAAAYSTGTGNTGAIAGSRRAVNQ